MEALALSIEQMHFLKSKFNISDETASMIYNGSSFNGYTLEEYEPGKDYNPKSIRTFTAIDLLKLLPRWQLTLVTSGYEVIIIPHPSKYDNRLPFPKATGSTVLAAVYNMVCLAYRKDLILNP